MAEIKRLDKERTLWTAGGPVPALASEQDLQAAQNQSIATFGQGSTLGLFAFATGTWMAGTVLAGVFPPAAFTGVAPVLLIFAGLTQFIAGLIALRRANVLAGSAFCSFGAFNAATAMLALMQAAKLLPMTGYPMVLQGFFIESFAFMSLAFAVAALSTNVVVVVVLALVCVGEALSGIPFLADAIGKAGWATVGSIGGWFLVASSFCAYYLGSALLINSLWQRSALPLWGKP